MLPNRLPPVLPVLSLWQALIFLALILLTILVSGCQTLSGLGEQSSVDPSITKAQFSADQQQRRDKLQQWRVSGVLEVAVAGRRKRMRAEMHGEHADQVKVTIYGPMRQVMMVLFAGPNKIRLVDPVKQHIVEVPATEDGLANLIGILFPPKRLFTAFTALATALDEYDASSHVWTTHNTDEQLILHPDSGLIQERIGMGGVEEAYRVMYEWGKPDKIAKQATVTASNLGSSRVQMPTEIKIIVEDAGTTILFKARQWQIVQQPFADHWFSAAEHFSGFPVVSPAGW